MRKERMQCQDTSIQAVFISKTPLPRRPRIIFFIKQNKLVENALHIETSTSQNVALMTIFYQEVFVYENKKHKLLKM